MLLDLTVLNRTRGGFDRVQTQSALVTVCEPHLFHIANITTALLLLAAVLSATRGPGVMHAAVFYQVQAGSSDWRQKLKNS
jgi:hypothetical protein